MAWRGPSVLVVLVATMIAGGSASAQSGPVFPGWTTVPPASAVPTIVVNSSLPGVGLDQPRASAYSPGLIANEGEVFEVVPLKYADISEVVSILTGNQGIKPNDNFSPQEPNFGSSGSQGYFGGSGLPATPMFSGGSSQASTGEPIGQAVDATIGVDRRLNAVVLRGSPARIATIKREIAQLDVPVTSVVLETEFVELSETGARNLGLDFANGNNAIGGVSVAYSHGYPGSIDTPGLGGIQTAFQVALYAQIAKGEGRIVSKPRIAAQSGGTAKIITGDALPILTSIALSGVNAVQQQVSYVNVGVTLQIAPRVSDDGFVTAHVFAVVSSVTGYSQGYPTISQREASTTATVPDGQAFVIGGLTQESRISNKSKIPLLGDVPLLGSLFTVEHSNRTKRDLYIVVTPHIVRSDSSRPVSAEVSAASDH